MNNRFGEKVCSKTISNFFKSKKEFMFEASFCVPNKVPLDKYTNRNIIKIYKYQETMTVLYSFVKKFNFLDKEHILNHDCITRKVRRDPLTGKIPAIYVSGNFCNAHNIFACISASEHQKTPITYHIERNNGTAVTFVKFICNMIKNRWLVHNEVLIMDNAAIHTGKEAKIVNDLLWDTVIDVKFFKTIYYLLQNPNLCRYLFKKCDAFFNEFPLSY